MRRGLPAVRFPREVIPKARWVIALAGLALLALPACGGDGAGPPPELRVVLITIDTLRADGISQMPKLAARARSAARFEHFYSSTSTTQPSHASIFTGLHPWQHGVTRNGHVLADQFSTLAEDLAEAGFATSAVVGGFPVAGRFGFAQGFDHYADEFREGFYGVVRWAGEDVPELKFYSLGDHVSDQAIEQLDRLDRAAESRQFLWFHNIDPHSPYGSSQGGDLNGQKIREAVSEGKAEAAKLLAEARDLYASDLAFLDIQLDRLFARLEQDATETHVFLLADHGESFGEQGSVSHSYRLIDSQIRVPAFIWSPEVTPGERRDVASSIDVRRTLLSLAGVSGPSPGRDLAQPGSPGARAYGMRQTFKQGSKTLEQRLDGERVAIEGLLFYAVGSDELIRRGNSEVLWDESAPELLELFRSFEAELDGRPNVEISPEVERALEQLGYTQ
jgi:arylsulfatase A-like enzyme